MSQFLSKMYSYWHRLVIKTVFAISLSRKQFYVLLSVIFIYIFWNFNSYNHLNKRITKNYISCIPLTRKTSNDHAVNFLFPRSVITNDDNFNLIVVSAFQDFRFKTFIVLLTIGSHELYQDDIYCRVITKEGMSNIKISDKVPMIEGRKGYTEHFVYCPITENSEVLEVALFLDWPPEENSARAVPVITIPPVEPKMKEIAICVRPIVDEEFSATHLTTWIEFNRLLGVSHFIFYKYSAGAEITNVFEYYETLGLATTVNWGSVPFLHRVPESGVVGMLNDCLRRFTNRFYFLMFTDPTELIIPSRGWRLDQLISNMDSAYLREVIADPATRPVAAFTFQVNFLIENSSQIFGRNVLPKIKNVAESPFFRTTAMTLVTSRLRMGTRIVVGKMVSQVGANFVMQTENMAQTVLVEPKLSKFYSIASPVPDVLNFFDLPREEKSVVRYKENLSDIVEQRKRCRFMFEKDDETGRKGGISKNANGKF